MQQSSVGSMQLAATMETLMAMWPEVKEKMCGFKTGLRLAALFISSFVLCGMVVAMLFQSPAPTAVIPEVQDVQIETPVAPSFPVAASEVITKRGPKTLRILHIITSLDEYSNLGRGQIRGSSRLPAMQYLLSGVEDLCKNGIGDDYEVQVGVYIIAGWAAESRRKEFEEALKGCGDAMDKDHGLQIWENAIPSIEQDGKTRPYTRALARQHRFVIKKEWPNFDMFSAWEDDMYVGSSHYRHFLEFSAMLEETAAKSPDAAESLVDGQTVDDAVERDWSERLTRQDYLRILPGFVRVETSLLGEEHEEPLMFEGEQPCCPTPHPEATVNMEYAKDTFRKDELIAWEWGVEGLGVRYFPSPFRSWVAVIPGKSGGWLRSYTGLGKNGEAAGSSGPDRFGQQAGFMATKAQLERFQKHCPRGFLPPDSEELMQTWWPSGNVEFWSGGFQLFGPNRCRFARVMDITSPESFAKHLLFHTSNNKQIQMPNRMVSVEEIYNTMVKRVVQATKKAKKKHIQLDFADDLQVPSNEESQDDVVQPDEESGEQGNGSEAEVNSPSEPAETSSLPDTGVEGVAPDVDEVPDRPSIPDDPIVHNPPRAWELDDAP